MMATSKMGAITATAAMALLTVGVLKACGVLGVEGGGEPRSRALGVGQHGHAPAAAALAGMQEALGGYNLDRTQKKINAG